MHKIMQAFFVGLVISLNGIIPKLFPLSNIVIPVALYVILYRVLFLGYRNYIHPRFFSKKLLGRWIYTLSSDTTGLKAYGMFDIMPSNHGFKIKNGQTWYYGTPMKNNKRGTWYSLLVKKGENSLSIMYEMQIQSPPPYLKSLKRVSKYTGSMLLQMIDNKKQTLSGAFSCVSGTANLEQGRLEAINTNYHLKEKVDENNIADLIRKYYDENVKIQQENLCERNCFIDRRRPDNILNDGINYKISERRKLKDRRQNYDKCVFFI